MKIEIKTRTTRNKIELLAYLGAIVLGLYIVIKVIGTLINAGMS